MFRVVRKKAEKEDDDMYVRPLVWIQRNTTGWVPYKERKLISQFWRLGNVAPCCWYPEAQMSGEGFPSAFSHS
jgi:hypothetical protein